jgi:hypothetical protein
MMFEPVFLVKALFLDSPEREPDAAARETRRDQQRARDRAHPGDEPCAPLPGPGSACGNFGAGHLRDTDPGEYPTYWGPRTRFWFASATRSMMWWMNWSGAQSRACEKKTRAAEMLGIGLRTVYTHLEHRDGYPTNGRPHRGGNGRS